MIYNDTNNNKPIGIDFEGFDTVTSALRNLLNNYPALGDAYSITFNTLDMDDGITMYPQGTAVIERERRFITGDREQDCIYTFSVMWRAAQRTQNNKANVKEWLDNLGRWLEQQEVNINGKKIRLDEYPPLANNMHFTTIQRATAAHQDSVEENGAENWVISIIARYNKQIAK